MTSWVDENVAILERLVFGQAPSGAGDQAPTELERPTNGVVTGARTLADLLQLGFRTGQFHPLTISGGDPSAALQLQQVYDAARPELQGELRHAIVQAISTWRPPANGPDPLRPLANMAYAAALMRATAVVLPLAHRLEAARQVVDPAASSSDLAIVVRVLCGFAPDDSVADVCRPLLLDPTLSPRLVPLVCLSLLQSLPRRAYPTYLGILLAWLDTCQQVDQQIATLERFLDIVQLDHLLGNMTNVQDVQLRRLFAYLLSGPTAIVEADEDEDGHYFWRYKTQRPAIGYDERDYLLTRALLPEAAADRLKKRYGTELSTDTLARYLQRPEYNYK